MMVSLSVGNNDFYKKGATFLLTLDEDWEELVSRIGPCTMKVDHSLKPYQALIKSVIYQQLHPKAANSILKKFLASFKGSFPTPNELPHSNQQYKAWGLSKNKYESILDIVLNEKNQAIPTYKDLLGMKNEDIINKLIMIKGVGRWTAEMFLIFYLGRLDIMPSTDLALRHQYKKLKSLDKDISPKDLTFVAESWIPFRSIAAWYLWKA